MKEIQSRIELRKKLLKGVGTLAEAVGSTLGPKGRTVIIKEKDRKPIITKDGVTVCRSIVLEDPFENLGAQIVKQAAESTVQSAGDGTTTSIVLAGALYQNAQTYLQDAHAPEDLKNGINKAVSWIVENLKKQAKPIQSLEEIEQVAVISANGDKAIGKLISLAVDKVGRDGAITIQEGRSSETVLDFSEGFSFDSGLLASAFITDERRSVMRYEDCLVLITDKVISVVDEILPVLEIVARDGRPFIIITENVEGQALAALIMNKMKGTMKVSAIKAPRYGEERRNILQDLAFVTGGTFISRESGIPLKAVQLKHLGTAKIVEGSKTSTTIVSNGLNQTQVQMRIEDLKEQIKENDNIRECERIQERITRLASGIAIIKVGGATEVEMIEKKHRIEDALEAVNSAQQEGIVAGGSTALLKATFGYNFPEKLSPGEQCGFDIVLSAVIEPFIQMIVNAGSEYCDLLEKMWEHNDVADFGLDISTMEFKDMVDAGIIDPLKVVRSSLQNAASAVGTLITSDVAIVEI